jgi:tetratricopeptide (TPR) repeat protein
VYREAVRECEPDPTCFSTSACCLEDASRNEEAVAAYQQALAEDPDFGDAHYNLARLYEYSASRNTRSGTWVSIGVC